MYPSRKIPPGAKCITPKEVMAKLARRKSWLWGKVKNDPTFPRPIHYGPRATVFIEQEIDAWLERLANQQ
jgi:prophage regulatory protein